MEAVAFGRLKHVGSFSQASEAPGAAAGNANNDFRSSTSTAQVSARPGVSVGVGGSHRVLGEMAVEGEKWGREGGQVDRS